MIRFLLFFSCLIGVLFSFSNCAQLSSLQTGRTVGQNELEVGGGLIGYGINDPNAGGGEIQGGILPHLAVWGHYGLLDNVDAQVKISTGGNLSLAGKWQFIGDQESSFAMAIAPGIEGQINPSTDESGIFRTHLPLYLSIHPSDRFAAYATPKYIYQVVSDDANSHFLGSSLGVSYDFSDRVIGAVEGSYFKPFTEGKNNETAYLYQIGLGLKFRFGR